MEQEKLISWFLENDTPELHIRVYKELLGENDESEKVRQAKQTLLASKQYEKVMKLLHSEKIWERYDALVALAEWGMTRNDVPIDEAVNALIEQTGFHMMCGEALLLRNLVKLGYYEDPRVKEEVKIAFSKIKEDGGFGCLSKDKKINDPKKTHKSCFRITASYLMLAVELKQIGVDLPEFEPLVHYFLRHDLIYRTDDLSTVMVPESAMTFYPVDAIKIGIQNLLYAMAVFGKKDSTAYQRGLKELEKYNQDGIYILMKSKSKPSFKSGKLNQPNKWITFYALLAFLL